MDNTTYAIYEPPPGVHLKPFIDHQICKVICKVVSIGHQTGKVVVVKPLWCLTYSTPLLTTTYKHFTVFMFILHNFHRSYNLLLLKIYVLFHKFHRSYEISDVK